jgi:predicted NAD/FAD-binding protein
MLRPSFYRMIRDILRFNQLADALVAAQPSVTLGDFLAGHGFRGPMVEDYLLPMAGAIWSAEPSRILDFPASHFGRFFRNHGLLQVEGRPHGGPSPAGPGIRPGPARLFRDRLLDMPWSGCSGTRPVVVKPGVVPPRLRPVVFACHSDRARAARDPTDAEREVLGAITWQDNDAVPHGRPAPARRAAWAAWNYHCTAPPRAAGYPSPTTSAAQSLPTRRRSC